MCRYTDEDYKEGKMPTIGLEFKSKRQNYDGNEYNLQIWDTAGQEEYKSITRNYYKGATVCFLVYDVTRKITFYNIVQWLNDVKSAAPEMSQFILVANKIDNKFSREISFEEGKAMSEDYNMDYIEVSAQDNYHIEQMFNDPLRYISKLIRKEEINQENMEDYGLKIQGTVNGNSNAIDKNRFGDSCNLCCK